MFLGVHNFGCYQLKNLRPRFATDECSIDLLHKQIVRRNSGSMYVDQIYLEELNWPKIFKISEIKKKPAVASKKFDQIFKY